MANLENARDKAEEVRYSDDKKNDILDSDIGEGVVESWTNDFVRDCLRINPDVTPNLCSQIEIAVRRLGIPPSVIEGYVTSSPEINASCFYPTANHCFINLTSGLIELLDTDEMIFVIGSSAARVCICWTLHFFSPHLKQVKASVISISFCLINSIIF